MIAMMMTGICQRTYCEKLRKSELTNNEQAPPLLAVASPGRRDGRTDLLVCFYDVVANFLSFLLDVLHHGLLLHDDLVEVLEQLCQFHHLSLNPLDGLVTLLDISQARLCLSAAVGTEELQMIVSPSLMVA